MELVTNEYTNSNTVKAVHNACYYSTKGKGRGQVGFVFVVTERRGRKVVTRLCLVRHMNYSWVREQMLANLKCISLSCLILRYKDSTTPRSKMLYSHISRNYVPNDLSQYGI